MSNCYEIETGDPNRRMFILDADRAVNALFDWTIPLIGASHPLNPMAVVVEKRAERIDRRLHRVTVWYEDPTLNLGAGI